MSSTLENTLRQIALGETGQQKSINQSLNAQGDVYRTERSIVDAAPNAELIKELIDLQIGGEKDWC